MKTHDILRDAASRPGIEAAVAIKGLSAEALNAHPGGHPNSIAWLLWHAGRQMDMQLSTWVRRRTWRVFSRHRTNGRALNPRQ